MHSGFTGACSSQNCRQGLSCWPKVPKINDDAGLGGLPYTLYCSLLHACLNSRCQCMGLSGFLTKYHWTKTVLVAKLCLWRNILCGEIFCVVKYSVWQNILCGEIFCVVKYSMWQNILCGKIFCVVKYSMWQNILVGEIFLIASSRVGNLLFHSWLFSSCRSLLKEQQERITLVALYKKSEMSKSFSSLFLKERLEQNEQIALFTFSTTRAIRSLWKSDSLFLRVQGALLSCSFLKKNWKLDWKIYITLIYIYIYHALHNSS